MKKGNIIVQTYNSGGLNEVTNTLYIKNNKLFIDIDEFNGTRNIPTETRKITIENINDLKFILSDNFRIIHN